MQEITVYDYSNNPIESLVQWDSDVYVYVHDSDIKKNYRVHFFNTSMDEAFVVESEYTGDALKAKIPNSLLIQPYAIIGYINVEENGEQKCLYRFRISIVKKPKPSNFVLPDTKDYINIEDVLAECKNYASNASSSAEAASSSEQAAQSHANDAAESASTASSQAAESTKQAKAAAGSASTASEKATEATKQAGNASKSATEAKNSASTATQKASDAAQSATEAESYAHGGTDTREGEDEDNAKYYKQQAEASASAAKSSQDSAKDSEDKALQSETKAKESEDNAKQSETKSKESEKSALSSKTAASKSASDAENSAKMARSYTEGDTGLREGEDTDNAKYYYEQSLRISQGLEGALLPMGTIKFAELETKAQKKAGYMYNISDAFTSTENFEDGGSKQYGAGTNIYYTANGKWDALPAVTVTGVKGNNENGFRQGGVIISPENLKLDNFAVAATRANVQANDTLAVAFSKLAKYCQDLHEVAFSGDYNKLINKPNIPTKATDIGAQPTINGAASTITESNLIANMALISNGNGKVATSNVTSTQLGYLSGATSNIQTQLNSLNTGKVNTNDARLSDARTPKSHTHDDRYYTEAEVDNLLANIPSSMGTIEMFANKTAGKKCYIDFHHNNNPNTDYTVRIIEDSQGTLKIIGNLQVTGTFSHN